MSIRTQNRVVDALTLLQDDTAAITASADGQVDSSAQVIDLGSGNDPSDTDGARVKFDVMMKVSALKISANDEQYDVLILGSDGADFSSDKIVELGRFRLGPQEIMETEVTEDDAVGTYEFGCTNMRNGTVYRYIKIRFVIAGTSPSITLNAYMAGLHY